MHISPLLGKRQQAIKLHGENAMFFSCPLCRSAMALNGASIVCSKGHCFDLAKKGYFNFAGHIKAGDYDAGLFNSRRAIFEQGFYTPLKELLKEICLSYGTETSQTYRNEASQNAGASTAILDAGCGEGYYIAKIAEAVQLHSPPVSFRCFGIDISKAAINYATDYRQPVHWSIADLSNLPFRDRSMDIVLNVLTPANYGEFSRVLKPEGMLIKVMPGSDYLKEIRSLVKENLRNKEYSNEQVLSLVRERLDTSSKFYSEKELYYTLPVDREQGRHFYRMTPMTSGVATSLHPGENIHQVTIHFNIAAGPLK